MASEELREGVNWNVKSTTVTAKKIWSTVIEEVNADLAKSVNEEKNWRANYGSHVVRVVEEQMKSPEVCMSAAEKGLAAAWDSFCFVRDGKKMPLEEAMATLTAPVFEIESVTGGMEVDEVKGWEIPYEGETLNKEQVIEKVTEWANYGSIESDCTVALQSVLEGDGWKEAIKDKVFVLIGATSEMGPLLSILKLGGHVLALARPSASKWEKLIAQAKTLPGTFSYPIKDGVIGADVLSQTPEITAMVSSAFPEKKLVVGSYIYLDGEAHVRATMAMDAIIKGVSEARKDTTFAWIVSPALPYPIPKDAYDASIAARENAPGWHSAVAFVTGSFSGFVPNDRPPVKGVNSKGEEEEFYVHDGVVNFQGPNYVLAKSLQNWRTLLLHQQGFHVSANYGPPARTLSVTHSSTAATALKGAPNFAPNMVFDGETVSPILFGLLLADILKGRYEDLSIPYEVLEKTAWHGGSWRCPWKYESMGSAIYLTGLLS